MEKFCDSDISGRRLRQIEEVVHQDWNLLGKANRILPALFPVYFRDLAHYGGQERQGCVVAHLLSGMIPTIQCIFLNDEVAASQAIVTFCHAPQVGWDRAIIPLV